MPLAELFSLDADTVRRLEQSLVDLKRVVDAYLRTPEFEQMVRGWRNVLLSIVASQLVQDLARQATPMVRREPEYLPIPGWRKLPPAAPLDEPLPPPVKVRGFRLD